MENILLKLIIINALTIKGDEFSTSLICIDPSERTWWDSLQVGMGASQYFICYIQKFELDK